MKAGRLGGHIDRRMGSGRVQRRTWLLWPALLPDANGEVVGSVHTAFTVCQVFAAPLGSRPDVQADQGSPPKASSSFTWEWGVEMGGKQQSARYHAAPPPPLLLAPLHRPGASLASPSPDHHPQNFFLYVLLKSPGALGVISFTQPPSPSPPHLEPVNMHYGLNTLLEH